jgi:hypothetical protein
MTMQTLSELEHSIGGRPKMKLRRKKVRLSFYLGVKENENLKKYADNNDKSISQIVRESLKPLLKI